jgi:TP901 family phage tail tape measure protein
MAIQLPPLHQRIILDPTGVKGGASAYSKSMGGVTKASVAAGNATAKMGTQIASVGYRAQSAGRVLMKNFGLPIVAVGALAVKSFVQFEASMIKIEALVGVSAGSVARFGEAVKEASLATGRGPQELADAMFFVASAGLRGSVAMEVLAASAKGAAIGLGQTKVVADAATSAVNAYGAENLSGSEAVDVLTAAVREGKIEANRLAPAIGKAIPVASAMGIQFHEVAAAIAAMTRTGTDARTSAIQLRQIMQSLLDPSRQTTRALKEMGIAENELREQARNEGLLSVLKRLRDLSEANEDTFADIFPNIRALAGALDITGANLTENEGIFRALANSVGDTDEAFQKTTKGGMFKFTKALAEVKGGFLALGESMLPVLTIFAGVIVAVGKFVGFIAGTPLMGFVAGMGAMTLVAGALLMVMGKLVTVFVGFTGVIKLIPTAMGVATISMKAFFVSLQTHLAVTTGGLYTIILLVGALVSAFVFWGRNSDTTVKDLADLRDGINDVRQVGERSLKPIHDYANALTHLGQAVPEGEHIGEFNSTWGDAIEAAGNLSKLGGQVQAEGSILAHFAGILGDEDDQEVIDAIVAQFTGLIAGLEAQFAGEANPLGEVFTRLFPAGANPGDEILAFLTDPRGLKTAEMGARVWADGLRDVLTEAVAEMDDWWDSPESGSNVEANMIDEVIGPVEDALGEIPHIFQKHLTKGGIDNAITIYLGMMDSIRDNTELTADEIDKQLKVLEAAFQKRMHAVDGFLQDSTGEFTTLGETLEGIVSGSILVPEEGFAGDERVLELARLYGEALAEINAEREEARRRGGMDAEEWAGLSQADVEHAAIRRVLVGIQQTERALGNLGDAGEGAGNTIAEALLLMEKGFTAADDAAKEFTKRFDDIIGRQKDLVTGQAEFRLGLVDMADALVESSGAIDNNSVAALEAQVAIGGMIDEAKDLAVAMYNSGAGAEESENAFNSWITSITETARMQGVSSDAIGDLLMSMQVNPESMQLLFADKESSASDALMAEAARFGSEVGPFMFNESIGMAEDTLLGYVNGLHIYKPEMISGALGVFKDMYEAIRSWAGIKSPSVLFQNKIGEPIGEGVHQGVVNALHESKGKFVDVLRDYVNTAISVTNQQINTASGAIKAVLSLEDAQQALLKAQRETMDMETGGSRSHRENLSEKQLQRRVDEAKRALRLGQGFQEDLEMSLLDAKEAMADFLATADSESPVAKAELGVIDASFKSAQALAQLKMGGPETVSAFKNMAEASGLGEVADELLALADHEGTKNIFEEMFSDEVKQSIKDVGEGLGIVEKSVLALSGSDGASVGVVGTQTFENTDPWTSWFLNAEKMEADRIAAGYDPLLRGTAGFGGNNANMTDPFADARAFPEFDNFQGMWGDNTGTTYDVGGVNIVVATASDVESLEKIAQRINSATATGILGSTGTDATQFQSRGSGWNNQSGLGTNNSGNSGNSADKKYGG